MPMPNILVEDTWPVANAANTTAISTAADVTIRPVRSRPRATAWVLSPVRSYSSFTRLSMNTS